MEHQLDGLVEDLVVRGLEALVEAEGWQNLVPEAGDAGKAISDVRAVDEWDISREESVGVLALRVRATKRKVH